MKARQQTERGHGRRRATTTPPHTERGVDAGVSADDHSALIAAVPDHDGRVVRQPADLLAELEVLRGTH